MPLVDVLVQRKYPVLVKLSTDSSLQLKLFRYKTSPEKTNLTYKFSKHLNFNFSSIVYTELMIKISGGCDNFKCGCFASEGGAATQKFCMLEFFVHVLQGRH